MSQKYIHIQCEDYALLTDIRHIEQVVNAADSGNGDMPADITWQDKTIPCLDLTRILTGGKRKPNRHCIIMKDREQGQRFLAVAVGQVSNIESIAESDFEELPNLDFPFNNYFNKAYIDKKDKRCIYRLKNLLETDATP